ncbi:DUF6264 family protein [Microbacterium sp. JZ31]|uniref:DUF6264 family protein n=1 Tax=Microbacterium sp. JZ31 TaxID=1906274 RepID=UPI001931C03E|nr:DUF6264 family protein [Microbacterium sp. JZ31]
MTDSESAAMSGDRPRPQYGEYATPEEQAARIQQPLPPLAPVAPPAAAEPTPSRRALTPGRILDRAVAIGLLVYGVLSLVSAIPATLDPAPLLTMLGLDADEVGLTATGAWGIAAAITLVFGWLVTAWATYAAHRRGWVVFWIPFVGGFVFNAISAILITAALLSDPAVLDAVMRQSGA